MHVRTLKGNQLELSTPNLVQSIAESRNALILGSNSQGEMVIKRAAGIDKQVDMTAEDSRVGLNYPYLT